MEYLEENQGTQAKYLGRSMGANGKAYAQKLVEQLQTEYGELLVPELKARFTKLMKQIRAHE